MKNFRLAGWSIVGCVVVTLALVAGNAEAQKTKGKTRAALTKQLMKGFVAANCGELGKLLKAEPTNWDEVALKAALLNEAGYILMDDGRCPDGDWAGAAKAIQGASAEVLAAAEKKDLEATNAAFKKLTTEGCAACHKVHKK
jgi:cytochrome c556